MTTIAAPGFSDPRSPNVTTRKPAISAGLLPRPNSAPPVKIAKRVYDVAGLRNDGSFYSNQTIAPAHPLFEAAFSAFARGSLVQTAQGQIAIEDLQPGDMLITSTGQAAELVWIGSSSFTPSETGRRAPLVRIMADAFGVNRPDRFLTVGPGARILQTPPSLRGTADGAQLLTPARAFVDGVNVIEVVPPTPVRLFHLCLKQHAAINVGGLEMETFHPGIAATHQVTHALRDQFLSLFEHIAHVAHFGPLGHPRAPEEDLDMAS